MDKLINLPILQTERLILRKFTDKEVNVLFVILSDKKVNTFLPWFPLKSQQEAKLFYEERYKKLYDEKRLRLCSVSEKDNIPIGYIKISDKEHDLSYGLLSEFWHNGIITEASKAVITQAKKDGLPFITATHDINNPNSGKVMQKCGMTYHIVYAAPKKEGICDKCGAELILRDDDKPETVTKRLSVYHEQTRPLISFYADKHVLYTVDGTQNMEQVFEAITKILGA